MPPKDLDEPEDMDVESSTASDLDDAQTTEALKTSQWWRYAPEDLTPLQVSDPAAFAEQVLEQAAAGMLRPFETQPLTARHIAEHLDSVQSASH